MATPNPEFNRLFSTTIEKYIPRAEDNIFTSKPFLFALTTHGNVVTQDGGTQIVQPLMYAAISNQGVYGRGDIWSTDEDEGHTAATYDWRRYFGMITLENLELAMNSGSSAVLRMISEEMMRAELSISESLDDLFLNGDGVGDNWNGLANIVSDSNTFGGINSSTAGNEWWQAKVTPSVGAQPDMTDIRAQVLEQTEGNDGPTNIFTTDTLYAWYDGLFEDRQRFLDPAMADQGFEHFRFHGIPFAFDRNIAAGTVYVLNFKYLTLFKLADNWFKTSDWEQPINQDAVFKSYKLYGQLGCSNRQRQGVMTDVTAAAA